MPFMPLTSNSNSARNLKDDASLAAGAGGGSEIGDFPNGYFERPVYLPLSVLSREQNQEGAANS